MGGLVRGLRFAAGDGQLRHARAGRAAEAPRKVAWVEKPMLYRRGLRRRGAGVRGTGVSDPS